MTDFILRKLEEGFDKPEYRWDAMLNPLPTEIAKKKSAGKAKTVKSVVEAEKPVKAVAKKKEETTEKKARTKNATSSE